MSRHRQWAALAALMIAALLAAGCGSSSSTTDSSSSAGVKALDINAMPRDKVKDGGSFRWAIDEFPKQWNYNQVDGPTDAMFNVIGGLMPSTFGADEKSKLTPETDYVLSAKVTSTTPKQVITYELNQKAIWSDGTPITAKDYIAQWKALNGKDERYLVASTTAYEDVESVVAGKTEYEVVATFSKPFGEWQQLFNPLYPAATNSDPAEFNKGWLNKIPLTAGPFKLGKFDRTAKTITIVRDPKWWGDPAKLDSIIFRSIATEATIGSYANGEVDYADIGPDPAAYKRALTVTGGSVRKAAGPDFRHFTINGTAPLLKDVRVRQAIAMGIDREVITKADLTGLDWPVTTLGNHFLVNTQAGYVDNSADVGKYDPTAAGKLLDTAGWTLSGGLRKKNGKTLVVRFVIPAGVPTSKQEGELTIGMLKKIGVKVDLRTVPGDDFFTSYVIPGNYDITPFSWIGTPYPISSGKAIYLNPTKDSKGELQIQQNFARVGTPEIDALMRKAIAEVDRTKAVASLNEADTLIWKEVHSLTMFQRPQLRAVKATLANVGAYGFKSLNYPDMGYVK